VSVNNGQFVDQADKTGAVPALPSIPKVISNLFNRSSNRLPSVFDNASKGYSASSVWQAFGQIFKPVGTVDNNFAGWTPIHKNATGNFVDVVGQINSIFAGGLVAMKGGYVGIACIISVTIATVATQFNINILPSGELDVSTLQSAMARADAGTDVYCVQLNDQSGNNNHAVKDTLFPAPIIDFDPAIGRYVLQTWNNGTAPAVLRLPHGLVAAGGATLTSGFGVMGNNYSTFSLVRTLAAVAGPQAFYSVGDYGAADYNVGAWSAATTYAIDQYVSNGFKSRANGNLNNALPAAGADNASWYYSPAEFTSLQLDSMGAGGWQVWSSLGDAHTGVATDPISGSGLSVLSSICNATGTTARVNEFAETANPQAAHAYQGGFICQQRHGMVNSPGYMLGIAIANTAITVGQEQAIRYNAYTRFNIQPQALDQVFLLGDSRTNSSLPLQNARITSLAMILAKALSLAGNNANVYNLGVGSQTTASILSGQVPYAVAKYKAGVKNKAYVFAGVNDFIVSGSTPAQAVAGVKAIVLALKTAGFEVVVINEIATLNASGNANTNLPIMRGLINAAGTNGMGCDAIFDLLQFSQLADPTNAIFYADGLHPTETFWEVAATIMVQSL